MGTFYRNPRPTEAFFVERQEITIHGDNGSTTIHPGNWGARDPNGEVYSIDRKLFKILYSPDENDPLAMEDWEKAYG